MTVGLVTLLPDGALVLAKILQVNSVIYSIIYTKYSKPFSLTFPPLPYPRPFMKSKWASINYVDRIFRIFDPLSLFVDKFTK